MSSPTPEGPDLLELFRAMLRIRRFEERSVELYSAAAIRGFMHLCIGEEAVAVGVIDALDDGDAVVSTYREHGHALARGVPMAAVFAEMFGRTTGCSRGRGGSMHLFDAERRFFGGNAIVAGGLPMAVGLGLADQRLGRAAVTACLFGDGAAAEGEFHESLNLAALWRLPVLFCCENNRYAMGTSLAWFCPSVSTALVRQHRPHPRIRRKSMSASFDRTSPLLPPGRFAVDEERVNVERPQPPGEDERR